MIDAKLLSMTLQKLDLHGFHKKSHSQIFKRYYLCCCPKVVSKVDAHYPSILKVHHEVGQVAISNAQHVLAAGD